MTDTTENEGQKITPLVIVTAVLRRKLLFLAVVVVAIVAAGAVAWRMTFTYESVAELLVKPGAREAFSVESAALQGTPIADRQAFTDIANTLAILQSRAVTDRLVDRLLATGEAGKLLPREAGGGVAAPRVGKRNPNEFKQWLKKLLLPPVFEEGVDPSARERDILRLVLARAIVVEPITGTSVVQIKARWNDPRVAYSLADLMLEVCREHYQEFYRAKDSIAFVQRLVKEAEKKLQDLIKREDDVRTEFRVADVSAEIGQVLHQLGRLNEEYTECQMTSASSTGRSDYLTGMIKKVKPTVSTGVATTTVNPKWSALYTALQDLKLRKLETRGLKGQKTDLDKEIERVTRELAGEPMVLDTPQPLAPNPLYSSLEAQMVNLEADTAAARSKCTAISEEIQTLRLRHNTLERVAKILDALKMERILAEEELRNYLRSLQAARTADLLAQGRISNLQVIERPEPSTQPIKNRKPLVLAGGLAVGVLLGALLCFLLYWRAREIVNPGQLREVAGLKVIGVIPQATQVGLWKHAITPNEWS